MNTKFHFLFCQFVLLIILPAAAQDSVEFVANSAQIGVVDLEIAELLDGGSDDQPIWIWEESLGIDARKAMEAITGLEVPDGWTLEQVDLNGTNIQVSMMEKTGVKSVHRHQTQMNFSRIISSDWRGFFAVCPGHVQGLVMGGGQTFELAPLQRDADGKASQHAWLHVDAVSDAKPFHCGVEDYTSVAEGVNAMAQQFVKQAQVEPVCAEVALDMDHYTYSTFNSCADAVDWALGLLAGANEVYMNSLDNAITLQPVHMNIWFSPEPFANISGNASAMLNSLRDAWNDDPYLSAVHRDVVHLLTKRGDTGTGGIAFVTNILGYSTLCSNSAYGLSSDLSQSTAASPNYSWNLNVICHELAHNFGSRHTHWCGWPGDEMLHPNGAQGGAFLVCTEPDEGPDGPCDNPVEENVGTIMSYCHNNGSVVLDFHPVVKTYGILPYTSEGTCLTTCDDFVEPCSVLGCTDPSACNFDGDAVVDDGTCSYPEFSYVDCQGNCLEDIDNDGVCDAIDNCVGGVLDECDVCDGPGPIYECGCFEMPLADCDCEGNQFDALGECGGDCAEDADADGICDDEDGCVGEYDVCGVCNGPGAIYECGCNDLLDNYCNCDTPYPGFVLDGPWPPVAYAGELMEVVSEPELGEDWGIVLEAQIPENTVVWSETVPQLNVGSWQVLWPTDVEGTGFVKAKVVSQSLGCESDVMATLEVDVLSNPATVSETSHRTRIYPNPTKGEFVVECEQAQCPETCVWSLDGRLVAKSIDATQASQGRWVFDTKSWSEGIYAIHVGGTRQRIVVIRD